VTENRSSAPLDRARAASRRYLQVFAACAVGFAGLLLSFNALVDPFGIVRIVTIPGFNNDRRPALESWHRQTRELEILRHRPDALVLGTSRELYGLRPEDLTGRFGRRPHNAALAAASIPDIEALLAAGLRLAQPRHVLIGLDYFSFDDKRGATATPAAGAPAIAFRNAKLAVRSIATFAALQMSIETIKASRCRPAGEEFPADGHRDIVLALRACGKAVPEVPAPEAMAGVAGLFNFESRANAMASFERILAACAARAFDCQIFVGPLSGAYLTVLAEVDWEGFQAWKRDLAALSERYGVVVHDFTSAFAASTLPLAQRADRFYDSLHYGPDIGAEIGAALAGPGGQSPSLALSAANLAALRGRDEEAMRLFADNAPEFAARLRSALRARPTGGSN
jgi:hypothetical protein